MVWGLFNVPGGHFKHGKYCTTIYSPSPTRLEVLPLANVITGILRPRVLVRPGSNSRPPAWQPDAQPTEPSVRGSSDLSKNIRLPKFPKSMKQRGDDYGSTLSMLNVQNGHLLLPRSCVLSILDLRILRVNFRLFLGHHSLVDGVWKMLFFY